MSFAQIVIIRAKAGMEADFEAAFLALQAAVKANEPATHLYQLVRTAEVGTYKVLEIYEDQGALDAHRAADHMKTLGGALGPFMAGRPEVERLDVV